MAENFFDLYNKMSSNIFNILLEIINDLQKIINDSKDDTNIKRLTELITKMNNYINENRKTSELIKDEIFKLYEKVNKQFDDLKINNINNIMNNQEIKYNNGSRIKYIGQVLNGVPEGKGIMYWDNGDRYEGEWKNDKKDGKGTYYYSNGERYEGDWVNDKREGKGIIYFIDGNVYKGDWKNDNKEGKGINYRYNGNVYEKW